VWILKDTNEVVASGNPLFRDSVSTPLLRVSHLVLAPFFKKLINHSRATFHHKFWSKSCVCQNESKLCANVAKGYPQQCV